MKQTTKGLLISFLDRVLPGKPYAGGGNAFYDGSLLYGSSKAGVSVNETSALNCVAVYASVRVLSETLASLPLFTLRRLDKGREKATDHPLYSILHNQFNPEMTSFIGRETMMAHLVTWGNAYALIDYEDLTTIKALWPLLPDRMNVTRDAGQVVYQYSTSKGQIPIPAFRILHIPGLGFDGLVGYSPISMAREAIGLSLATEEFGARFFSQGTNSGGYLEHPGKLGDTAYNNLKKSLKERYEGLSNASRLMILEEGMKFNKTTIPPNDAQFLETRKFQRSEIASFFHLPPHMIGDLEHATFSNIEQQSLEFVTYTMRPWLVRWEQAMNAKLFTPDERSEFFTEFLVDGLLRGDAAARSAYYNQMFMIGAFSRNDIREKENMNPVEGGDETYIPLNMVPASQAGVTPQEEEPGKALRSLLDDIRNAPIVDLTGEPEQKAAKRNAILRQRTVNAYQPAFSRAATAIVAEETGKVGKAAEKYLASGETAAFTKWLDQFYKEFPAYISKRIKAPVTGLAQEIERLAKDEVNAGRLDSKDKVLKFVTEYLEAFSLRYTSSSSGQLQQVVQKALDEDVEPVVAVSNRLSEWQDRRAGKIALNETVQLGNAIAKTVFGIAGIRRLKWSAVGSETCPFCQELDGKTVGIERNFVDAGGRVGSLSVDRDTAHPPIHEGCVCAIVPD